MKKLAVIILITLLLIGVINIISGQKKLRTIKFGNQELQVESVSSPEQITKGLGGRESIGSDGMLFVLPQREVAKFWMKDMRFELDFVWIDGNKVVGILPNIFPQPGLPDSRLNVYSSGIPVTHVLELPSGDTVKRGIVVGDKVTY